MRVEAGAIQLDGRLHEDVWRRVPAVTDFVQKNPVEGVDPTEKMEVRIAYDDAAVYVGENSAAKLAESLARLLDDPVARERMGRLGGERIRAQLNWERSIGQLLAAYETALR